MSVSIFGHIIQSKEHPMLCMRLISLPFSEHVSEPSILKSIVLEMAHVLRELPASFLVHSAGK